MPQSTTLILFPETAYDGGGTANVYTLTGESKPAAAYYLGNRDLQTVNMKMSEVTANIVIQATLATTPSEIDWFDVFQLTANWQAPSNTEPNLNSNISMYTNIEGNFVYMRAKIEDFAHGVVQFVKLSY